MTDLPSRLADLRCPGCGSLQPLYVARPRGRGLQRGARDVVACPGCGLPLRIEADPRDPGGVIAGLVMTLGLTGAILGLVFAASRLRLDESAVLLAIAALVVAGIGGALLWNARASRRRRVHAVPDHAAEDGR